jgi:membrane protease YdiL (CAAX protease family)
MTGPEPAATVAAMNTLRRAFVADDGRLNLVWRVVLYLLSWWVVFFLGIILATLVANLFHWDDRSRNAAVAVFAVALLIAWTAVYRRWVDRRPWRGIGLTTPSTGLPMIAAGFVAGSVLVGVWFLIDLALGWVQVVGNEPATSGVPQTLGFVVVGLVGNMGAGFLEEIGYRGYLLQNLASRLALWVAMPLMAVLFAFVVHFNKLSPGLVATAILIGMLFGLTRLATGAIWFAIGLHWAYDGAQNFFFGLSTTSPPYNHSLLHLQARGFLASSGGDDWTQVVLIAVALVGLALWMQHTGRLNWRWRLDDEGLPRSEAD